VGVSTQPTSKAADPRRNPSYPQRTHIRERAKWDDVMRSCDTKLSRALTELAAMPDGPARAEAQRLVAQIAGARDQVADMARRLPMEVGHPYDEDRERLEFAVEALERVLARWERRTDQTP
jgi:hypothetical protein